MKIVLTLVFALWVFVGLGHANLQLQFNALKLGTGPFNVVGNVSADAIVVIDGVSQPGRLAANTIFQTGSPQLIALVWAYDQDYETMINDDGVSVSLRDVRVYLTCPVGSPQLTYARGVNNQYSYFIGVPFPTSLPTAMPTFATLNCPEPPICSVSTGNLDFGLVYQDSLVQQSFNICNIGDELLIGYITEDCNQYAVISGSDYSLSADQCQNVVISFQSSTLGTVECTVNPGSNCDPILCTATVIAPPICHLSTETLDFGILEINQSAGRELVITNTGGGTLVGQVVSPCSFLTVDSPSEYWLEAGQSQSFWLTMTGANEGAQGCTLQTGTLCGGVECSGVVAYPLVSLPMETFDHWGNLAPGWTVQSQPTRSLPWAPVQESGSDWVMETSHEAFDTVRDEWLISPVLDLSSYEDLQLGFWHQYTHAGSSAAVRYSVNGGLSWNTLQTFGASASGYVTSNISSWADGVANARFAFRFRGDIPSDGASWRIDDFFLAGVPAPPIASMPLPEQPPEDWNSLSGTIGCRWEHPMGVAGGSHEWRVDMNGDGDYLDGGQEDWQYMGWYGDAPSVDVQTSITVPANGIFHYEFRAQNALGRWGYSGTSGQAGMADDWSVSAQLEPPVAGSPEPQQVPVQPWIRLDGTVGCNWQHPQGVDGSTLELRRDMNGDGDYSDGGEEDWIPLPYQYNSSNLTVQTWVVWPQAGSYHYELRVRGVAGVYGYSGSQGREGIVDDWQVTIQLNPPVADLPQPSQPMGSPWLVRYGTVGCRWQHPAGVDGGTLQVRWDSNGDGDYADGGPEDWSQLDWQSSPAELFTQRELAWEQDGVFAFEFRAMAVYGLWGYSGSQGLEGISDDWTVTVQADLIPPTFTDFLPVGQPTPAWEPTWSSSASALAVDGGAGVAASSIASRVDWNHNGSFEEYEYWSVLAVGESGPAIALHQPLQFSEDGEYRVEFQAWDLVGNGPASSGAIVVRVDTTPPSTSSLFATGATGSTVNLLFSPATDLAFSQYEVHVSGDADVTREDPSWGVEQDAALSTRTTTRTDVGGLLPGIGYWFKLWACDQAGNWNAGSNTVYAVTEGVPIRPIDDLHAGITPQGVLLSWTAPTEDVEGGSPVTIERYEIHAADHPWFVTTPETRIGNSTLPSFLVTWSRSQAITAFYQVITKGSGPGALRSSTTMYLPAPGGETPDPGGAK